MKRMLYLLLVWGIFMQIFANSPPRVNAGEDQVVRINNYWVYLFGEASDDSTSELEVLWSVLNGPASPKINDQASLLTHVSFPQIGEYVFELRCSDGILVGRDTVVITVIDSLPFIILSPRENEQIEIGKPYMIRWQLEPMRMCEVAYSLNGGISFERLTYTGAVSDSFEWFVDPSFKDSTREGILKVYEYQNEPFCTFSSFILVDTLTSIKYRAKSLFPQAKGWSVYITHSLLLQIAGNRQGAEKVTRIFSPNGMVRYCFYPESNVENVSALPTSVLFCRFEKKME